ncbi:four-carbon acid sugar kinase family protein [Cohnella candidum]|uniref:Four-carbon acid sugar kinase family protein n=1 Tax=Cohnella candidum TaxID=2674991 RepID=A0A3G3K4L8_9BACL|nr:four-carbon acid sugar kinase family protein [Cohnella candidum]AYQ75111.1 four-carbon acid sugar kinase family protein [Cohnella candidum]
MKFAIIADDLTGANDTGVQFARRGLHASVLLEPDPEAAKDLDVVVIDTDSRSLPKDDAYRKVKSVSEYLKPYTVEFVYKKIDSTMRGNIGAEIDAVYDVFQPELVIIAPAYPKNKRIVKGGDFYLDGTLLHETEMANDPKTPVTSPNVAEIIRAQSGRSIHQVTSEDLQSGYSKIQEKLAEAVRQSAPYVVFDAMKEEDLRLIVHAVQESGRRVVWIGSAGLANHLCKAYLKRQQTQKYHHHSRSQVLTVVGSVNRNSRSQLDHLLKLPGVEGVQMKSHLAVQEEETVNREKERIATLASDAIKRGRHVVLYTAGDPEDITLANGVGAGRGWDPREVSDRISRTLGETAAGLIRDFRLNALVMTGGDTAKQVCSYLGVKEFQLIDEVEIGMPIGLLRGDWPVYAVTKAGGFGAANALSKALKKMQGES